MIRWMRIRLLEVSIENHLANGDIPSGNLLHSY